MADLRKVTEAILDGFGNFQSGWEVGSSENNPEAVLNLLNFAASVAPTLGPLGNAIGVGLSQVAITNNTVSAIEKWKNGTLQPSDVLQITSSVLTGLSALAVVLGGTVPLSVAVTVSLIGLASGAGARDVINDLVRELYDSSGSTNQGRLIVRQYSINGTELFSYQLTDKYGFSYDEVAHLNSTTADNFWGGLPAGVVRVLDGKTGNPIMEYVDNSQVNTGGGSLINQASVQLSDYQFNSFISNIGNIGFGSGQNTVDFTKSILNGSGIFDFNFIRGDSISGIYQESVNYFKNNDYYSLIDPGNYWDEFDTRPYLGSGLNFNDSYTWLYDGLWNATTTNWYLYEKTTNLLGKSSQVDKNYVENVGLNSKWGSPIAIDLDGDGLETIRLRDSSVRFDLTGDGEAEWTAWLSGDDGFLAYDANGNGVIDGVSELFGGLERGEGYGKLAAFDSNGDGVVDSRDENFDRLLIWQDLDQNGVSDEGELRGLTAANITEVVVEYRVVDEVSNGVLIGEESSAVVNGNRRRMADIYFRYEVSPMNGLDEADVQQQADALLSLMALPAGEASADTFIPLDRQNSAIALAAPV
ncbi:EF-hand domain-containing protein [Thauera sinica]|uniref:Uncharacterized protein n=1 Tax=Thauera sinica TaxID=2665146 RepID=A0ABW1AWW6_9RHOO|nr:hypothetical protein [Thauera sp. K11]